jgi:hypothetical protein
VTAYQRILDEVGGDPAAATGWARRLLRGALDGAQRVRAVRHPLGFVCLPVVRDGPDGVCVHWWHGAAAARLTTEAIHAHSWDLLSFVLYGTLRNDTIRVVDDKVAPTHRVFEVHSLAGGRDELRGTTRTVRVGPVEAVSNAGGSSYRVGSGEFHRSALVEPEVATLVFGRTRPGAVDLTLAPLDTADHGTRRESCDAAQTRGVVRAVLDRLPTSVSG